MCMAACPMAACIPYACLITSHAHLMHAMMRLGHDACLNVCSHVLMKETCIAYACDIHDDDDDDDGLK